VKAAIKREQSDACISYAKREQVRCETSKVKREPWANRLRLFFFDKSISSFLPPKNRELTRLMK